MPASTPTAPAPKPAAKKKPSLAPNVKTATLNITDKALLLAIDFKKIGNRKKVPKAKVQIDADDDMHSTSKALLDSEELFAVRAFDKQVQNYLANRALPSMFKSGVWMIPMGLVEDVDAKLQEFGVQRKVLVEKFVVAYPALRAAAQEKLKGIYDPADYYEHSWQIRAEFDLKYRFIAFTVPNSLKSVKESIFKREQEKAEAMWADATKDIQNLLRAKLAELVEHIVDRLTPGTDGKPKKFHDTLTDNLNDFLGTFDARNIADDADLKALVEKAKSLVAGKTGADFRDDADLKAKMSIGFAGIKAELDKIVQNRPNRKIKFAKDDTSAEAQAAAENA